MKLNTSQQEYVIEEDYNIVSTKVSYTALVLLRKVSIYHSCVVEEDYYMQSDEDYNMQMLHKVEY
jgi:hypothetical protein